ncbi:hypothetical protein EDE11_1394 [Methylomonas methanica]|uniref:Uncharacterized protein n=1 Tax=Methylomonas methanica TaxID=421 RepID=A0ABY2CG30_METMH|nr:hypothetical protein EDE11_1394 [Methylomonas methanica]
MTLTQATKLTRQMTLTTHIHITQKPHKSVSFNSQTQ